MPRYETGASRGTNRTRYRGRKAAAQARRWAARSGPVVTYTRDDPAPIPPAPAGAKRRGRDQTK